MSELKLYLVWCISECGKGSRCSNRLFCSFVNNDREYFLDEKEADKNYQIVSQISSRDDESNLISYYMTFSPNDVIKNPLLKSIPKEYLESVNQENIEQFPNEMFCLWKISNISLIPCVINLFEFKDLVLKELKKYESNIDANDYLYGIDKIVIDNETISLKIDLDLY